LLRFPAKNRPSKFVAGSGGGRRSRDGGKIREREHLPELSLHVEGIIASGFNDRL
jgi:hypothetical protein